MFTPLCFSASSVVSSFMRACLIGATVFSAAARADSSTDYMLHCRGCHGPDGSGVPGGAPPLQKQVGRFLWVPGGREYLIRVPGTAQSELSDARVARLLNWILYEFSAAEVPVDFAPFTEEEVTRDRRSPLPDVFAARRELMRAIAAREAPATESQPAPSFNPNTGGATNASGSGASAQ